MDHALKAHAGVTERKKVGRDEEVVDGKGVGEKEEGALVFGLFAWSMAGGHGEAHLLELVPAA